MIPIGTELRIKQATAVLGIRMHLRETEREF